eukprot:PLAT6424.4.p1 GENE.PLAT6424.4~~PLAT6424.4.p1  ORF type:complete len:719 (-),score=361.70 PLAT6424.4:73-2175(-)
MHATATPSGVKIYDLSSGKTTPEFMAAHSKKALRKMDEYRRRIQLIQDFDFPIASQCVEVSRDEQYIVATGTYKPTLKIYDVADLSLKVDRGLTCETVALSILDDDYSKLALLLADRTVEVHAAYGFHHRLRVPKFGRTMQYNRGNCELLVAGGGSDIYRLNLDQGRFMAPFATSFDDGINTLAINPLHQLIVAGGEDGWLEAWDPRARRRVARVDLASQLPAVPEVTEVQMTSVAFASDGLLMAAGSSAGHAALLDLRKLAPMVVKEHQSGLPVSRLAFHDDARCVLSMDRKVVKIWNRDTGAMFASVEPTADAVDLAVVPNGGRSSGLMLMAGEQSRVMAYYVPALGPAPSWASFLDSLTEELEEKKEATVYDDYKFVSYAELDALQLGGLRGTPLFKPAMHGGFIDLRLYYRAKAAADPTSYEDMRKKRLEKKLKKKTEGRITMRRKLPKVNAGLIEAATSKKKRKDVDKMMGDDRFGAMFKDEDFQMDETTEEFKQSFPFGLKDRGGRGRKWREKMEDEGREDELVDEEDAVGREAAIAAWEEASSDEEGRLGFAADSDDDSDDEAHPEAGMRAAMVKHGRLPPKKQGKEGRQPRMYEVRAGAEKEALRAEEAAEERAARRAASRKTMAERVAEAREAELSSLSQRRPEKVGGMYTMEVKSKRRRRRKRGAGGDDDDDDDGGRPRKDKRQRRRAAF